MKSLFKIFTATIVWLISLSILGAQTSSAQSVTGAELNAEGLTVEENETGIVLNLTGPVEIMLKGNTLTCGSAEVFLGYDLTSLEEAIQSITLHGLVTFEGFDGSSGEADEASYYAEGERVVLTGNAKFTKGELEITADSVDYSMSTGDVRMSGGLTLRDGTLYASARSADYNVTSRTGTVTGNVEVTYKTENIQFGDETIDELVLQSDALSISGADNKVTTPSGSPDHRTTILAGNYSLETDQITFIIPDSGLSEVTAEGNVVLEGPDINLSSENLSLSNTEKIINAGGGVTFTVLGSTGQAESIEVNFADGWSVRLTGASVEGSIDQSLLDGV